MSAECEWRPATHAPQAHYNLKPSMQPARNLCFAKATTQHLQDTVTCPILKLRHNTDKKSLEDSY